MMRAIPPLRGFTLVELLVSISIIAILASMVLFAMAGAQETAREDRTRAQIARIDALIGERWDSYENRRIDVPVREIFNKGPNFTRGNEIPLVLAVTAPDPRIQQQMQGKYRYAASVARVDGMRELMRMELPDRKLDLTTRAVVLRNSPYLWGAYRRKAERMLARHHGRTPRKNIDSFKYGDLDVFPEWSQTYQGSECLYLILSQMTDDDTNALEFLAENEIGDIDNDGMLEIHDSWGNPIEFLRWAPGFIRPPAAIQDREVSDPFDPTGVYAQFGTFSLYPLVYSAGPDKEYDIHTRDDKKLVNDLNFHPLRQEPPNNPFLGASFGEEYRYPNGDPPIGTPFGQIFGGPDKSSDNLHNHLLVAGS